MEVGKEALNQPVADPELPLPDNPRPVRHIPTAGLLTRGLVLPSRLPGQFRPVAVLEGNSPPTVAGAVTELAPFGYTAPCSLLSRMHVRHRGNRGARLSQIPKSGKAETGHPAGIAAATGFYKAAPISLFNPGLQ